MYIFDVYFIWINDGDFLEVIVKAIPKESSGKLEKKMSLTKVYLK